MTLQKFILDGLEIFNLDLDLSFYLNDTVNDLNGAMRTYVDDICSAGDKTFLQIADRLHDRFDTKPSIYDDFHFSTVHIHSSDDDSISVDEQDHAK